MSASRVLRSDGSAYVAVATPPWGGAAPALAPSFDMSSAYGALLIEMAVHALPVKKSSDTESHAVLSYHEGGPSGADLALIGITPLGSLVGYSRAASGNFLTAPGTVVADSQFRRFAYLFGPADDRFCEWEWVSGRGTSWRYLNSFSSSTYGSGGRGAATGTTPIQPTDSFRLGTFMLFNGRTGLSRVAASIRCALIVASNATVYWPLSEGSGHAVADDLRYNTVPYTFDGDLAAATLNPYTYGVASTPWGPPPSDEGYIDQHLRWVVNTEYERITRAKTAYARVGR